jgi:hypothetical protein
MTETVVALSLAYLVVAFLMRPDATTPPGASAKRLLVEAGLLIAASWMALGLALVPAPLAIVGAAHPVAVWVAKRGGTRSFTGFMLVQAAHLIAILLAATLAPDAFRSGVWGLPALRDTLPWMDDLPAGMALAAGLVATVWAGGYAVQELMRGLKIPSDPESDTSLPQGGQLIGRLERLMILILVLAGEAGAIGFLIAAKSVLRFNELARDQDRHVSEYVIIGTLASFAWALVAAFATQSVLAMLSGS